MSESDESLFREVDEEVRQDQYKKIWDRYGNLLMAMAFAIVAGVGGVKGWQYYQQKQAESAAVVYADAVKKAADGKYDDAASALAAINHGGFAQLAELRKAGDLAQQGKRDEAVAAYDAFAANGAHDPAFIDMARIRAGYLLTDTLKPDELLTRLGPYDKDDQVWRHAAREIFGLSAWRTADYAMADRYMTALYNDPATPPAMRQRAQMMMQLLTPLLPKK